MEPMEYIMATKDDVDIVVDYRVMFSDELNGKQDAIVNTGLRKSLRSYFNTELNKTYFCWYAKAGDEVAGIGGMGIRIQPGTVKNPSGRWGYIMSMYVVPEYRKKGIGNKILDKLIVTGTEQGITAFELHATKEGEGLYIKNGFVKHVEPTYRRYT